MKRIIAAVLMAVIAVGLAGCAAEVETEPYNLQNEMYDMSRYLGDKSKIVDVDINVLNDFMGSVEKTDYRLRGMVTDYKEELHQSVLGDSILRTCYLVSDGMSVHIKFADGETATNGEYIEVVGGLSFVVYSEYADDRVCFSLWDCVIVERGASVRERVEDSQDG